MAEAEQQLALLALPPEGRRLGEIIEPLVGAEHWSALLEHSRHYSDGVPLGLATSTELYFDPRWWVAMQACSPLLDAWNAGNLIAHGRRRDPLSSPVEIMPPALGWTMVVCDFERSIISDPTATRDVPAKIYDLRFSPSGNKVSAEVSEELSAAAIWIVSEAKRLKAADRIPEKGRKTKAAFAKFLADRMRKAAKDDRALRPVGHDYIRNQLSRWHLWPIDSIE